MEKITRRALARLINGDEWQARSALVAWLGEGGARTVDEAVAAGLLEERRVVVRPPYKRTEVRATRVGIMAHADAIRPADEQGAT